MIHLQKHLVLFSRHQWLFPLSRFATTAASSAPAPFAVADYLVASCHLDRDQALRVSQKLSHLKSPSNPDAVLAFLSGFGLTPEDIAVAVVRHPKLLCCKVDKTLAPRLAALKAYGLSASQIASFLVLDPRFLLPSVISKLEYYVPLFGSVDAVRKAFKHNRNLIGADLERVVKPNVKRLDAQLRFAVSRDPWVLTISEYRALRTSKFLLSVIGLDPEYISCTPALLRYALESRQMPRHYVMEFLKANGLLKRGPSYYTAVQVSEKVFMEKFIQPFKEAAPHLAEDYSAACRGEVPSRLRL
ncbi:hypothetical protein HU200_024856 [Digitaria exilis]|uniref:Uncharacterized protein n=1 Tax=Digitaria exilis TaxID=1010633 RepID=A0A835EWC7_9POAL|nr:hypothetical protein HU200_024856 [Digitaria exilis]